MITIIDESAILTWSSLALSRTVDACVPAMPSLRKLCRGPDCQCDGFGSIMCRTTGALIVEADYALDDLSSSCYMFTRWLSKQAG